ncbi:MAG: hypothetical protein C0485_09950 [Pirellula sp.]|nr:hypothetical protein [Pirellula sp.]
MPSILEVFGSDETLRADHLPAGVPVPCVIESATPMRFDDGGKLKLTFRGKQRCLMCNKTNGQRIADQIGPDYSTWPGKLIYLQRSETEFKGSIVPCVRVALAPPAMPAARMAAPEPPAMPTATAPRDFGPDDEIPF